MVYSSTERSLDGVNWRYMGPALVRRLPGVAVIVYAPLMMSPSSVENV
nr:hypothetical protein [Deltaproteobacteria bacterium]